MIRKEQKRRDHVSDVWHGFQKASYLKHSIVTGLLTGLLIDIVSKINYSEIMMVGLLRIIAYGILAYLIYLLYRFFKAVNRGSKRPRTMKAQSGVMVKDETCNTYLPKEDAIRISYEGRDFFFCSEQCKQKFLDSKKPH